MRTKRHTARQPNPDIVSPEDLEILNKGIPLKCVSRRHMRPAAFMTYNAMYAWASVVRKDKAKGEGPLLYKGGDYWLANSNNRNVNSERTAIKELEKEGWILKVQEASRGRGGRFTSNHYRLLEHDEYEKSHPNSCPANRYVSGIMAEALGLEEYSPVGREVGMVPPNFIDSEIREADGKAVIASTAEYLHRLFEVEGAGIRETAAYMSNLSEADRQKILNHWKRKGNGR
jgi:hypothetical protein